MECGLCRSVYASPRTLNYHIVSAHNPTHHKMTAKAVTSLSKTVLPNNPTLSQCADCGLFFGWNFLERHLQICRPFLLGFPRHHSIIEQLTAAQEDNPEIAERVVNRVEEMIAAAAAENISKPAASLKCGICGNTYAAPAYLYHHMRAAYQDLRNCEISTVLLNSIIILIKPIRAVAYILAKGILIDTSRGFVQFFWFPDHKTTNKRDS